ncbi:MAG: hypothetical protein PHQ04_11135 [Opitutaceae bacterium]|nr:hypothetical protein [Opitutaceae bacterium]
MKNPAPGDEAFEILHKLADAKNAGADPTTLYLALLAWVAQTHPADFADFVSHQESGRRYLALSREEIQEVRRRKHTRQIASTPYWAVLNIATPTKRRFACRLLEFIGCHDETIALASGLLSFPPPDKGAR